MKRVVAALSISAATAFGVLASCTVWNDAVLPAKDAGAAEAATTPGSRCPDAPVPSTRPSPDAGTGGDIDVVVAVASISLGIANGKLDPAFGYDLDGLCTCNPDPGSCTNTLTDAGHCDGDAGRDDATGVLVASLALEIGGDPSSFANQTIQQGQRGIIIRIQNYNGLANDDSVTFSLYRSPGIGGGAPVFSNPDQAWQIDNADIALSGGTYAPNTTGPGFVKDGLLVAQLASSRIPFNADSDLELQQVSFTGALVQDNGRWNLQDAVGVGRWPLTAAINTIAHVQDPTNSHQRLCNNDAGLLNAAKITVCSAADIVQTAAGDKAGQNCDALSTAVSFTTAPAKLGDVVTPEREDPCADAAIPSCN